MARYHTGIAHEMMFDEELLDKVLSVDEKLCSIPWSTQEDKENDSPWTEHLFKSRPSLRAQKVGECDSKGKEDTDQPLGEKSESREYICPDDIPVRARSVLKGKKKREEGKNAEMD